MTNRYGWRGQELRESAFRWSITGLVLIWSLIPIIWLTLMATQPERNYLSTPMTIRVSDFSLEWFRIMISDVGFISGATNSIQIAVGTTVLSVSLGALAAYALARLDLPGKSAYLGVIVFARIIPSMILVVPIFLVARTLRLLDTIVLLVIVYTALFLPFATWLLKNYFEQVPREIEKAARMDGCTRLSLLYRIILPLSLPGLAATSAFVLIGSWNSFLFGLILTSQKARPITLALSQQVGGGYQPNDPTVSQLAAAGILTFVPVMILVIILNRQIIRGLIPGTKG